MYELSLSAKYSLELGVVVVRSLGHRWAEHRDSCLCLHIMPLLFVLLPNRTTDCPSDKLSKYLKSSYILVDRAVICQSSSVAS